MDFRLKKTGEHGAEETGGGEDAGAFGEFGGGVPGTEDEVGADEGGGFEEALEETDGVDLGEGGGGEGGEGEEGPEKDGEGEPVASGGGVSQLVCGGRDGGNIPSGKYEQRNVVWYLYPRVLVYTL